MQINAIARLTATAAAVTVLVIGAPLAASAHVRVTPDTAAAGDDIQVTFRVPNEEEAAGTVKVEIDLPRNTPFADAEYEAVPGWTAKIVSAKLPRPIRNDGVEVTRAPVRIIYTADEGTDIHAGQFQEFPVALDLTPDTGKVEFPVIQTYSNGDVVKWDQSTPASGEEPDHPAPTLYINDAPPPDSASGVTIAATSEARSNASTALIIGSAGLAVGMIALVLGVFAFVRSRR